MEFYDVWKKVKIKTRLEYKEPPETFVYLHAKHQHANIQQFTFVLSELRFVSMLTLAFH